MNDSHVNGKLQHGLVSIPGEMTLTSADFSVTAKQPEEASPVVSSNL